VGMDVWKSSWKNNRYESKRSPSNVARKKLSYRATREIQLPKGSIPNRDNWSAKKEDN